MPFDDLIIENKHTIRNPPSLQRRVACLMMHDTILRRQHVNCIFLESNHANPHGFVSASKMDGFVSSNQLPPYLVDLDLSPCFLRTNRHPPKELWVRVAGLPFHVWSTYGLSLAHSRPSRLLVHCLSLSPKVITLYFCN